MTIKPDKLENVSSEMCADKCSDDELMVPELHETDETQNLDTVNTQ